MEKTYIIMDIQDPCEYWEGTIEDIKDFILVMWGSESFKSAEEEAAHDKEVMNGNIEYLISRLEGMDYTAFETEEERLEWMNEVEL